MTTMITEPAAPQDTGIGPPSTCTWVGGVCPERPTMALRRHNYGTHHYESALCVRHYILVLAELIEVHLPTRGCALEDHVENLEWPPEII